MFGRVVVWLVGVWEIVDCFFVLGLCFYFVLVGVFRFWEGG